MITGTVESSRFHDLWMDLTFTYVRLQLTWPSDKLVAISAIAAQFALIPGRRYLVGLWGTYMWFQLGWHVED